MHNVHAVLYYIDIPHGRSHATVYLNIYKYPNSVPFSCVCFNYGIINNNNNNIEQYEFYLSAFTSSLQIGAIHESVTQYAFNDIMSIRRSVCDCNSTLSLSTVCIIIIVITAIMFIQGQIIYVTSHIEIQL